MDEVEKLIHSNNPVEEPRFTLPHAVLIILETRR
jgi:hypothetical protein